MSVVTPWRQVHDAAAPTTMWPTVRGPWLRALLGVVRRELREQRRSIATWGGALGALGAFMVSIYPSIESALSDVVDRYPSGLREVFGVDAMTTVEGYVHAELFSLIVPLTAGWFAIRSVMRPTILAEEHGDLDTVLSLPLPRTALPAGAFLASVGLSAAILAALCLLTFAAGRIAGTDLGIGPLAAGGTGVWCLAVVFAGVATLASGLLRRASTVAGVAAGTMLAMYALDLAGRLTDSLGPWRIVSAFRYAAAPLRDGLDVASALGLVGAGTLLAAAGAGAFARRDVGR